MEYSRNVYETTGEDGLKKFVFLLDEMFSINNVGLISQNMAEQLVAGITELSYHSCAEKVSAMTGQCISAMGVWNVIQTLGQQVSKDEQQLVCAHKQGQVRGSKKHRFFLRKRTEYTSAFKERTAGIGAKARLKWALPMMVGRK